MTDEVRCGEPIVWLNGTYMPLGDAAISPLDRGFLYGDGVFETLRAESGRILDLGRHLERLGASLRELKIDMPEPVDWETTLSGLLFRNGLDRGSASVKIVVTRGVSSAPALPPSTAPTVFLLSRPYAPPTEETYQAGWALFPAQSGFSPPLACHKSLNYLYFLMARQQAQDQGFDEAVILDPTGKVTETTTGGLLVRSAGKWWSPASPFKLPSVTLRRLTDLLAEAGRGVERRAGTLADLANADTVWVVSSLVLIMPVRRISDHLLPNPAVGEAGQWRHALLTKT